MGFASESKLAVICVRFCLGGHDDRGTAGFRSKMKAEGSNGVSSQCVYLVQA